MSKDGLDASTCLRDATLELRRRWKLALSTLGISSIQLVDLVELADPRFECDVSPPSSDDVLRARLERYDYRFQRFPLTAKLASPYEMLLVLHDQGCSLITEHRIIDMWSPSGEMLGGVAGLVPWDNEITG